MVRMATILAMLALGGAACTSTPSTAPPTVVASTTATPGPTVLPSVAPTLRPLTAADLGDGWSLIATDSNVSGIPRIAILGGVKVGISFAFECVGTGTARVSFAAAGGSVSPPPVGANEFYSKTYACPTLAQEVLTDAYDGGGVSISPDVDPSDGVTYRLIVGTQPG